MRPSAIQKVRLKIVSIFWELDGCGRASDISPKVLWSLSGKYFLKTHILSSRYLHLHYINARFAYVRFASGLIKDCAKLLHILALVFFATCYTNWDLFFFYYFFYKDNYKDLKMVFCTKQNITAKLDADFIGSSVKPKMMLIFTTGWIWRGRGSPFRVCQREFAGLDLAFATGLALPSMRWFATVNYRHRW